MTKVDVENEQCSDLTVKVFFGAENIIDEDPRKRIIYEWTSERALRQFQLL